jgi:NADPH:quinone reductase and related Zn-dependent oxidoreductases
MHAIWMMRRGGTEVLKVREALDPQPGPDEVRIRVKATGLNFADIMARLGLYPAAPKPPCVFGGGWGLYFYSFLKRKRNLFP